MPCHHIVPKQCIAFLTTDLTLPPLPSSPPLVPPFFSISPTSTMPAVGKQAHGPIRSQICSESQ